MVPRNTGFANRLLSTWWLENPASSQPTLPVRVGTINTIYIVILTKVVRADGVAPEINADEIG